MKKFTIVFSCLLLPLALLHATEYIDYPINQKSNLGNYCATYYDQMKFVTKTFSFKEINQKFKQLPISKQNDMKENMSQSLIFSIAFLPQEIRYEILKKIFDNEECCVRYFNEIPILYAFERYSWLKSYKQLSVGNRKYSFKDLLPLRTQDIRTLVTISDRSFIEKFTGLNSNYITSHEDLKLRRMSKEVRKGLKVKMVEDTYVQTNKQIAPCCLINSIAILKYAACSISTVWCCMLGSCCCFYQWRLKRTAIPVEY